MSAHCARVTRSSVWPWSSDQMRVTSCGICKVSISLRSHGLAPNRVGVPEVIERYTRTHRCRHRTSSVRSQFSWRAVFYAKPTKRTHHASLTNSSSARQPTRLSIFSSDLSKTSLRPERCRPHIVHTAKRHACRSSRGKQQRCSSLRNREIGVHACRVRRFHSYASTRRPISAEFTGSFAIRLSRRDVFACAIAVACRLL